MTPEEVTLQKACTEQAAEILFDIEFKTVSDEQDAVKAVAAALMALQAKGEALYKSVVDYICLDQDDDFEKLKEAATAYGWVEEPHDSGIVIVSEENKNPAADAVVQSTKNKKDEQRGSDKS